MPDSEETIARYTQYAPIATERQAEYLRAYQRHGSVRAAAEALGVNKRSMERSLEGLERKATRRGIGQHFRSDGSVPAGLDISGTSTLWRDGQPALQWIKTRQSEMSPEELVEFFAEAVKPLPAVKIPAVRSIKDDDLMACYIMPEPHIGMLAWAEECGEDYDMTIAQRVIAAGFRHLSSKIGRIPKCLLLDGGDFFHFSGRVPETERSKNPLSSDGRWQKVMETGIRVYLDAIDVLGQNCRELDVVRVPGNHDPDWSLWLDNCLSLAFARTKHIKVDTEPHKAKAYMWGKTMIAVDHGEKKLRDFCEFAAAEWPAEWGQAVYRYVMTGHVHHKVVEEYRGVTGESINSIAARDDYHTNSKYKSHRSMMAIVYHREFGEVERHVFRPEMAKT